MKTLHLLLLAISSVGLIVTSHNAFADISDNVEIASVVVFPSTIKVGNTFTITTTMVNNSTVPIVLEGGKCSIEDKQASFFTVTFDNHAKIKPNGIYCAGEGWGEVLNPGKGFTETSPDYTSAYVATESGIANATVSFSYHVINQTDPTQPGFSGNISKSILFTILDNDTGTKATTKTVSSPLKQFRSGIATKDVKCKEELILIFKTEDGLPACVKLESAFKLVQWGWARPFSEDEYQSKYRFDVYPTIDYQNNLLGIQNRTYDFTILNDTMTGYHNPPLQIVFHGVVFTLFPSPWTGGPPGSCGGYQFRVDAKFDDGSHEQIGTFVQGQPCSDNYNQTNLSIHTNPQVGISVLHQNVMLLVSSAPQTALSSLHLSLSTNSSYIQYGHAIGIDISVNNTSPDTVTIDAASNPPRDDLNTGPCDNVPFGIAILKGFYTQDNMTGISSIPLFPIPPCPLIPSHKSFTFQPLSTQASMECGGMFSCTGSETMERHLSISGSLRYTSQGPFDTGVYTIVGGDEWGRVVIQHFTVTNSSGY
jgi:hypothetical protein